MLGRKYDSFQLLLSTCLHCCPHGIGYHMILSDPPSARPPKSAEKNRRLQRRNIPQDLHRPHPDKSLLITFSHFSSTAGITANGRAGDTVISAADCVPSR